MKNYQDLNAVERALAYVQEEQRLIVSILTCSDAFELGLSQSKAEWVPKIEQILQEAESQTPDYPFQRVRELFGSIIHQQVMENIVFYEYPDSSDPFMYGVTLD